jgi:TATA-binding protein-associated factor
VRSVAASCLLPVAAHLVDQLPEELGRVLAVLWSCLSDMKDDLSSSVGAVMDLLGEHLSGVTRTLLIVVQENWLLTTRSFI